MIDCALFGNFQWYDRSRSHQVISSALLRDAYQALTIDSEQLIASLKPSICISCTTRHHRFYVNAKAILKTHERAIKFNESFLFDKFKAKKKIFTHLSSTFGCNYRQSHAIAVLVKLDSLNFGLWHLRWHDAWWTTLQTKRERDEIGALCKLFLFPLDISTRLTLNWCI